MPRIAVKKIEFVNKVLVPLLKGNWLSEEKFNEYVEYLYKDKGVYVAFCLAMDFNIGTRWLPENKMMEFDTEKVFEYTRQISVSSVDEAISALNKVFSPKPGCNSIW